MNIKAQVLEWNAYSVKVISSSKYFYICRNKDHLYGPKSVILGKKNSILGMWFLTKKGQCYKVRSNNTVVQKKGKATLKNI